jgi:O-antigen/teichoic acid export membrane protein
MLGVFAGMGLGLTVTKYVAEYRQQDPARAGRIVSLVLRLTLISAGLVSIVSAIVMPYFPDKDLQQYYYESRLGCLLLFSNVLLGVQMGALAGVEAFRTIARINAIQAICNFVFSLGGMYLWGIDSKFGGLCGAVAGMGVGSILAWAISQHYVHRELEKQGIHLAWAGALQELPHIWRFALSAFVSSMLFSPVPFIHNTMMLKQPGGGGAVQLGLFTATRQWHTAILMLPGMISQTTLPMLTNLWTQREYGKYRKLFWANTGLFAALALVMAVPIALLSQFLMKLYDSEHANQGIDFASGWPILVWVCVYSVLWAANMSPGQAVWSLGMRRAANFFALLRSVILLGVYWYFLHDPNGLLKDVGYTGGGAMSLALAYTIMYVLQTLYMIPFILISVRRKMNQAVAGEQGENVALVDPDGEF